MYNSLLATIRKYNMIQPGERILCAVSGGADSMALLWGLYLLREKLEFTLEAAHFNHHLRGADSDRDAAFVAEFCSRFDIPLHLGEGQVRRGEKGLEAAAREARYAYFRTLDGKLATAHTADDNAETVLLNLVRGTGLKGLGAIAPVGEKLIRPMLEITRPQVLAFLQEYHIPHVEDGSNDTDDFLRNRLRHHVMPLLQTENPRIAENMSAMALRLRQDEACLEAMARAHYTTDVTRLRQLEAPLRSRILEQFLKENGVKEPTARNIAQAEALVFSRNPSAKAEFPGGGCIARCYDTLVVQKFAKRMPAIAVAPGQMTLRLPALRLICREAEEIVNTDRIFTVEAEGPVWVESRRPGDEIRLSGGTKSLKKLFIDKKIPAYKRLLIPVVRDARGILAVYGLGADEYRKAKKLPAMQLIFEETETEGEDLEDA